MHRFATALLPLLLLAFSVTGLRAQDPCQSEPLAIPWPVPPGIAAIEGSLETNTATRVVIGTRMGAMQLWDLSLGELSFSAELTPGNGLPANVQGIYDIATPGGGDEFVALVTYTHADGEYYGFLRSSDRGETWTLSEPAALRDDQFKSVEGVRVGNVNYSGNFWRIPLYEMEWLDDGLHGWVWGRQGIASTTDGGSTWNIVYRAEVTGSLGGGSYNPVWGLAMQSPTDGVAVIGGVVGSEARYTNDGGATFPVNVRRLAQLLPADIDAIGDQYHLILFDPQKVRSEKNTFFMHLDGHGERWDQQSVRRDIEGDSVSWSTFMTEAIWTTPTTGFLIQRQGEIWRTDDAGRNWDIIQKTDPGYDTIYYGDRFPVNGNGQPPYHPYAGYAQRTIATRDDFGDPYLVHALTDSCHGNVRGYVPVWGVGAFTSVPDPNLSLGSLEIVPNPTTEFCRVSFELENPSAVTLRLVSADGRTVSVEDLGLRANGLQEATLPVSGLPSGSYRLLLQTESGRTTVPVVIGR